MSNTKPIISNNDLHYRYIIFMLICAAILIACSKWSESSSFTTYLSNAATMTSLLLGVVAIFYSFISNDSMSRSLGSISTITTEVKGVQNEIQGFVNLTKEANASSETNTALVQDASKHLSSSLKSLEQTLTDISSQNATLQDLISQIPNKFDQLDAKITGISALKEEKPRQERQVATEEKIPDELIDGFLRRSTVDQNIFLIACAEAYKRKVKFDISSLCKIAELRTSKESLSGYFYCMIALQVCETDKLFSIRDNVSIDDMHPALKNTAKSYLIEYLNRTGGTLLNRDTRLKQISLVEDWILSLQSVEEAGA
ncbi:MULTISPECIES: hypothetical protein [Delftia]|nr:MULTISPECIES: hypothetical protein [Delftia]WEL95665.1 hypothetical protein PW274_16460 [Delftia tsuruhatensis]WQM80216.1 hypothetical protein RNT40_15965 [Delftia tsuruhatensis]